MLDLKASSHPHNLLIQQALKSRRHFHDGMVVVSVIEGKKYQHWFRMKGKEIVRNEGGTYLGLLELGRLALSNRHK